MTATRTIWRETCFDTNSTGRKHPHLQRVCPFACVCAFFPVFCRLKLPANCKLKCTHFSLWEKTSSANPHRRFTLRSLHQIPSDDFNEHTEMVPYSISPNRSPRLGLLQSPNRNGTKVRVRVRVSSIQREMRLGEMLPNHWNIYAHTHTCTRLEKNAAKRYLGYKRQNQDKTQQMAVDVRAWLEICRISPSPTAELSNANDSRAAINQLEYSAWQYQAAQLTPAAAPDL